MTTARSLYESQDYFVREWEQTPFSIEEHLTEEFPYGLKIDHNHDWSGFPFQVRELKNHSYDGERCWCLQTVWYAGRPFMIVQNAGRGGQDHEDRFITDTQVFSRFISALQEIATEQTLYDVIDLDEDRDDLDFFYDQHLNQPFEHWTY
jgi:hypothetical protein